MQTTITRVMNPGAPPSQPEPDVQPPSAHRNDWVEAEPAEDSAPPLWTWFIQNPRGPFAS